MQVTYVCMYVRGRWMGWGGWKKGGGVCLLKSRMGGWGGKRWRGGDRDGLELLSCAVFFSVLRAILAGFFFCTEDLDCSKGFTFTL